MKVMIYYLSSTAIYKLIFHRFHRKNWFDLLNRTSINNISKKQIKSKHVAIVISKYYNVLMVQKIISDSFCYPLNYNTKTAPSYLSVVINVNHKKSI